MKSPVAYYLLLLYLTVMFKPLIPMVSDVLAHTFNESIHIGTIHAIYGSNHLSKSVASTASEDNNKHQTGMRAEESVPLHLSTENNMAAYIAIYIVAALALFRLKKWTSVYLSLQLPPPKLFL